MNVILLSGGSGKRLWPLSNDVRSKQFIKLFKNNDEYESMVQRVYRQITTVDSNAKITIATSKSQASAIKNQLGEKASICVEPCRRDTFPAIALAAAYLHDELGVAENEAVVVCPVDPYVDNTYYEAVKNLQELAEQGGANLTLMGIEPTYPSEKYGYIIPESGENVSKVKEFKEKPDVETAKKYLAQSALWNAGIFAFKLGYLLDKAHSMINFEDYRDLFNKYDTLTKISFDYAVVEKESSIQVLRYSGDWKDVGTWNMMAEVMADKTKGKAILDETCENTNVVNELNIPILCMGCKDMIVAASGDGILIADKERSGYMKPYVEKIETEAMYAEKSWGTYTVIDVQPGSMTVKVSMRAGEHMTYHMHNYREEVWTVVSGKGKAIVDGMEQVLRTGDVITIAAGCKHTVEAITALDMIEVQLGEEISVADTRLREEYGKKIDLTPLAETWECSVHPDGPSYVINGTYKGKTLAEVLKEHPEYIGTKVENGELPVLVKFIDAKKDLSVQVHPNDEYAREHEGDNGKTEMWYVIDADEGASLIYGFRHEVTEKILRKAVETGTLDKHLQKVLVHKGDTYFVPAGTVHGIGKGILVAEIQESSNVTYRVYDYDRVDKNGKKRELHFDKAVQVMNMKVAPDVSQKPRMVKYYSGCSRELLCRCKYFETERIQVTKGFAFSVMDASFQVLMCLDGYGEVQTMDAEQKPMRFSKGETLFLPAGLGRCLVVGDAELIKVRC